MTKSDTAQALLAKENLSDEEKQRLKRLYLWRFEKARKTNMARFLILTNDELLALCRHAPDNLSGLDETGILSARRMKTFGEEILTLLWAPPSPPPSSDDSGTIPPPPL